MKKVKKIISLVLIIIVLLFSAHISVKYIAPHKLSRIVSTKNIEYVEFRKNEEYNTVETFRTLSSDELDSFKKSINSKDIRYKRIFDWAEPKCKPYDNFIIHYADGKTTHIQQHRIFKNDRHGKELARIIISPYKCKLYENLFNGQ